MRASDGDRDRVAAALREHYAQGRLSTEEFDERLEQLYTSKTYGELARLTSDLPDVDLRSLPEPASRQPERRTKAKSGKKSGDIREAWQVWAVAVAINWGIWFFVGLVSGLDFPYPWPLWVMGPWGMVLLVITLLSAGRRGDR
ncbi:DUF1707 domain-containing protein [Streptosporangium sp. NPDC048047]|uniref:DUF1707 SHOCT-like domain-containing protein n=1 Tax=Streptosporangium sp. NPDC048047 TaxID=3155748 RepID=UPI003420F295